MSKKETRRAARNAFPKGSAKPPNRVKTYGQKPSPRARSSSSGRRELRPPSLKRAAIQGAVLAILYLIIVRFWLDEPGTNFLTYLIMGIGGFIIYTGVAYGVDKFTYQRRLRKLKRPSK